MRKPDRLKLLFGTYKAPPLKRGTRADCLYRDTEIVVIWRRDARITRPVCKRTRGRGHGIGILVNEELARAVRH